ncbi:hypothetical protein CCUS01_09450 [Colletotrichum cuscutae]|uniref:Uncharacterized protein n=1 Tax=Colletotrichum cuscutae TaxID=1209917 RepID=A0AAI9UJU4_9PEZI|nr:hypothetical protein CCUS01_09450 [Colletotrichum cuscutae]
MSYTGLPCNHLHQTQFQPVLAFESTYSIQNGCQRDHSRLQHGPRCLRHDWSAQASSSPQASINQPRAGYHDERHAIHVP